jgi:cell division septum initiation protein DivIVA
MSDPSATDYLDEASQPERSADEAVDVEELIEQLIDAVSSAKSMPLSSSAIISREEVLDLLELARDSIPDEIRRARWMLRERDEFMAVTRREADDVLEEARVQAERMVQRTEIVRQAEHRARRILEDAEADARRMQREAEDFVDHKLGAFEIVLDKTIKMVHAGRDRLASVPFAPFGEDDDGDGPGGTGPLGEDDEGLFDQDLH